MIKSGNWRVPRDDLDSFSAQERQGLTELFEIGRFEPNAPGVDSEDDIMIEPSSQGDLGLLRQLGLQNAEKDLLGRV